MPEAYKQPPNIDCLYQNLLPSKGSYVIKQVLIHIRQKNYQLSHRILKIVNLQIKAVCDVTLIY